MAHAYKPSSLLHQAPPTSTTNPPKSGSPPKPTFLKKAGNSNSNSAASGKSRDSRTSADGLSGAGAGIGGAGAGAGVGGAGGIGAGAGGVDVGNNADSSENAANADGANANGGVAIVVDNLDDDDLNDIPNDESDAISRDPSRNPSRVPSASMLNDPTRSGNSANPTNALPRSAAAVVVRKPKISAEPEPSATLPPPPKKELPKPPQREKMIPAARIQSPPSTPPPSTPPPPTPPHESPPPTIPVIEVPQRTMSDLDDDEDDSDDGTQSENDHDADNTETTTERKKRKQLKKQLPSGLMSLQRQTSNSSTAPAGTSKEAAANMHATEEQFHDQDALDYLSKFCIISNEKNREYARVFNNVVQPSSEVPNKLLDVDKLSQALKMVNKELITDKESNFVFSVLDLLIWPDEISKPRLDREIDAKTFSVIAALSERVVALDEWMRHSIAEMDIVALQTKLKRAKELFYCNDPDRTGQIHLDDLRVEFRAGGISAAHESNVMDRLDREGRDHLHFMDYLAHIPLFAMIHDTITSNPFDDNRSR